MSLLVAILRAAIASLDNVPDRVGRCRPLA